MENERTIPGQGKTGHADSSDPLIFDGFDFSCSEEELRETILAWSEYIERLEREKPQDERTQQLLIAARRKRGLAWMVLGERAQETDSPPAAHQASAEQGEAVSEAGPALFSTGEKEGA